MMRKLVVLLSLLAVASFILAACGQAVPATAPETGNGGTAQPTAEAAPSGPKTLHLSLGAGYDVASIDPAIASGGTSSVQLIDATTVGLTRQNEVTTATEPGMATTWDVVDNDDGTQTVTFHLRDDVSWVKYDRRSDSVVQVLGCDGAPRMVTANDFVYGILRTLAPATASNSAYVLTFVIKGAGDYNSGASVDPATVAVTAIDATTLQITFVDQAVYDLTIAGTWAAHAQPSWLIDGDDCTDAAGELWTETGFFEGYGPFTMKELVHDYSIDLVKNPFWPGSDAIPQPKLDEVNLVSLNSDERLAQYEAGNLDAAGVPLTAVEQVKTDPTMSQELKIAPVLCSFSYAFNTQAAFVDDVRVRRALSEAIDRQSLIDDVLNGGGEPAQWYARPGLAGAPTMADHPDLGVKYDPDAAKADLQSYLDEKAITAADINITLVSPPADTSYQPVAETVQQMWSDTLGINVQLTNLDWSVLGTITLGPDTPQIFPFDWCQDYPDANNFDRQTFAVGGYANPFGADQIGGLSWTNADFERLVREASKETDPAARVDLYAQAEEILVYSDAAIIPMVWYTSAGVTKPYVTRTFSVLGGIERWEKWDINK